MLLFIFLIATLNLGVGYAMGKGLAPRELFDRLLELLPNRGAKQPQDADIDEEPLSRPAPAVSAPKVSEKPVREPDVPKRDPQQVLASLASLRSELSSASSELKSEVADPEKFEAGATKLQEASHAYVEEASDAIKELEELGTAGDAAATATQEAVTKGADRVAEISGAIDGVLAAGLDDEAARKSLVDLSTQATEAAAETENSTRIVVEGKTTPVAEPPAAEIGTPPSDAALPTASFASIDELFDRLEAALTDTESELTHHVAAVRIDPIEGYEEGASAIHKVEAEIAKAAVELLSETQTFVPGNPAMVLLDGDSFEEAKDRLETLRKRVETATFSNSGSKMKATVTCAFADARAGDQREQILEQLNLAFEESTRFGNNRIYHHDGAFPTPVDEPAQADEADEAAG